MLVSVIYMFVWSETSVFNKLHLNSCSIISNIGKYCVDGLQLFGVLLRENPLSDEGYEVLMEPKYLICLSVFITNSDVLKDRLIKGSLN